MPAFVQALGVNDLRDKDVQNTVALLIGKNIVPKERCSGNNSTADDQEPNQMNATGESHAYKNKNKNQGNTQIGRQKHVGADHKSQIQNNVTDGEYMGCPVLVRCHYRGCYQNVQDLTNFCRLNHERKKRQIQPASVTGVVIRAEGDQHRKDTQTHNSQQQTMLGEGVRIYRGHDRKQKNTQ